MNQTTSRLGQPACLFSLIIVNMVCHSTVMLKLLTVMKDLLKSIFNKFQSHIVEICDDRALRDKYVECDDARKRKGLFTRNRVWTFGRVVQAILSCFKRTLAVEVMDFLEKQKLPQTSPEAYIKRRGYISAELFRDLNCFLLKTAYAAGLFQTWLGNKYLFGIDGSRLSLPYTPELYRKYRQRRDRGHNLARGVFISDLVNRVMASADLVPNRTEERKAAITLLTLFDFPVVLKHAIFVMDRGYPSLFLMNWFHSHTGGFIIRARRDTNPQIARFMDSADMETTVELRLSRNRRDISYRTPDPLTVRLVKRPPLKGWRRDAEPVVFITDLDSSVFPADKIIEAYTMRWNIETEISTSKNELQIEIVSGIREICVRQDFFATIILYNMESLIRLPLNKKLASKATKHAYRVDMNCTWALMTELVGDLIKPPRIFDSELTLCVKFFLKLLSLHRPGRSSPRIKRVIKISGKYMPLTNYKRGL